MTAATGPVTTEHSGPVLSPHGAPGASPVPRLADGVELLGEYKDSGYVQPPSLVRRPDGQVIQMSRLLYQVTCQIDGSRDLRHAVSRGPNDPRVTGLRRRARIVVTGWVLCVIPLLTFSIGYLLLHLPQISRALWRSASRQAHLASAAVAGHGYAMAVVDALGVVLLALSLAGSLYIVIGLARRLAAAGLRWSAGRCSRRLLVAVAGLACVTMLAAFWGGQGQFRGW
jgi:hypothetical protein